jgi:hypothetical protein
MESKLFKWLEKPSSAEDERLVAWAHLINDPFITVYTMKQNSHGEWVEDRHYVNPDLAFKRAMIGTANSMMAVRDKMQSELFPAIENVGKIFSSFLESLEQSLPTSSDGVE